MIKKLAVLFAFSVIINFSLFTQENSEFTTKLMRSTYRIIGKNGLVGTGLILFKPIPPSSEKGIPVLITAKHILDSVAGDSVMIYFRKYESEIFSVFPYWLVIRENGKNIYFSHPTEDIAVMDLRHIPRSIDNSFLGTEFLATEEMFKEALINPGTELSILGYPFGIGYNEEFPILRGGKISSFPLVPVKKYKTYLIDFEIFGGNSGGIVYYSYSGWKSNKGTTSPIGYNYIVGLIIEQGMIKFRESDKEDQRLVIGIAIHSAYLIETIDLLPNL